MHGVFPVQADVEFVGKTNGTVELDGESRQLQGDVGAACLGATGQGGQRQRAAFV